MEEKNEYETTIPCTKEKVIIKIDGYCCSIVPFEPYKAVECFPVKDEWVRGWDQSGSKLIFNVFNTNKV